jgi:hypothetical protein
MEMVRFFLLSALISTASAAGFSLTIGPPVAAVGAKVVKTKTAVIFAVRLEECADPAKAQIAGTAEGLVDGARSSLPVMLFPTDSPGVYLVSRTWPAGGVWAVSLSAACGSAKAGAIVPIGPQGFIRESTKQLVHSPTLAEVVAVLESLNKN